jgi:hypothetical protein
MKIKSVTITDEDNERNKSSLKNGKNKLKNITPTKITETNNAI